MLFYSGIIHFPPRGYESCKSFLGKIFLFGRHEIPYSFLIKIFLLPGHEIFQSVLIRVFLVNVFHSWT